jgi:hypothetical protein
MEFWTHKPNETYSNGQFTSTFGLRILHQSPQENSGQKEPARVWSNQWFGQTQKQPNPAQLW